MAVETGRADKWIVRRNKIIRAARRMRVRQKISRTLVHVEAQDGGEKKVRDDLRVQAAVVLRALVADRGVKITVRPEVQVAAVVVAGVVVLGDQPDLRVGQGDIGVGGRGLKARNNLMPSRAGGSRDERKCE